MSDLTSLSQEFAATADFAQELNGKVLRVKKARLGSPVSRDTTATVMALKEELSTIVGEVIRQLTHGKAADERSDRPIIPEDVLERLADQHRGDMEYFIEDLRAAREELVSQTSGQEDSLRILDEMCDVADASASASFRRLRRR